MWNLLNGNSNMNKFERFIQHKGHLERISLAKKKISDKIPLKPSFLKKSLINMGEKMNRNLKIMEDNKILYKKMSEIERKKSKYSQCYNIPSRCPAYEFLTHNRYNKLYDIQTENSKMFKRLKSAKPLYKSKKYYIDYKYKKYLENNISKKVDDINPNLNFVSYKLFKNNLHNQSNILIGKRVIIKNRSCSDFYSNQYSKNNYYKIKSSPSRDDLLFDNYLNGKIYSNVNDRPLTNNYNNHFYGSANNIFSRPSSCKYSSYSALSSIENNNYSKGIYSDENNKKAIIKFPVSGKGRSNGSYSTTVS